MESNSFELFSLEREASSEDTGPERLTELARQGRELAQSVARNLNAPAQILAELSQSEDRLTRQAVAANPNTPVETLFQLGAEFPEQLLDNPVLSLLLLEVPNWIETLPKGTLVSLLKCQSISLLILKQICRIEFKYREVNQIVDSIAWNPDTPVELLEDLADNPSLSVRKGVARHPQTPLPILEGLVRASHSRVNAHVAVHPNTSLELLEQIVKTSCEPYIQEIIERILKYPHFPFSKRVQLIREIICDYCSVTYIKPTIP